ncbi:hypothetical protein PHLGIDRAFT_233525 [Phlebiopsis gigantea 11061_1 CR5-6]|uniref:F-box domain-containing protein n=1 Tax=Phlebiopsis gigantea (strain 11061_1 CR5-6) TaxID=745531 RepID=A0A0C3RSZ1_PHLG1|nr:hypothetical protein PHLGIDRAFT_233525 [Phlebiopsis gigantea 11061_1 CR5-6]
MNTAEHNMLTVHVAGMLRLLSNKDTDANKSAVLRRHAEYTNALAAVSRLPVEVLILALEFYVLSSYDKPECVILSITQVCRRWREIVLHTPSLWTRIELPADTEYLSAALQYSKAQTLDVKIGDATAEALDLIVAELPRTRHLR